MQGDVVDEEVDIFEVLDGVDERRAQEDEESLVVTGDHRPCCQDSRNIQHRTQQTKNNQDLIPEYLGNSPFKSSAVLSLHATAVCSLRTCRTNGE